MENKYKIKYWLFTLLFIVICYFLISFTTELLNGWNDPKAISTFTWIKGRLGEIIGFGISIVSIIYVVSSVVLLIINVSKFGFKNINYKTLSRLHSVVFTATIIYAVLYSIFFVNFNF